MSDKEQFDKDKIYIISNIRTNLKKIISPKSFIFGKKYTDEELEKIYMFYSNHKDYSIIILDKE